MSAKKITTSALCLALLVTLQWMTKPLGQIVTGSCVNAVLAVSVLMTGWVGGLLTALLSPIFAFLLGIAPNVLTVPAIMLGNAAFVALLGISRGKKVVLWLTAAAAKFAVLYGVVVGLICGAAADRLLAQGVLKAPMLQALPAAFSWLQLVTALIGGGVALLLVPILKKAQRTH